MIVRVGFYVDCTNTGQKRARRETQNRSVNGRTSYFPRSFPCAAHSRRHGEERSGKILQSGGCRNLGGGRVLASWRLPVKAFWTKDSRAQRYQATFWFHYTISPVMCTSHRLSVRYDEKYEDDKRHSSSLSPLPSAWLLSMLPCQDAVSPQP